ncbi:MAG: AMP-binding protein [Pseudomonadota bacterium]|nr:AMP-binding protein [Pseudomonadota bacterium]
MLTGYELVWLSAERTPHHPALVDDASGRKLTYGELLLEVDQFAAGLAAAGIGAGSRVATALPTTLEHSIFVLALMRLNAVPAMINFRLKPEEVAGLCAAGGIQGAAILPDPALVTNITAVLPAGGPIWVAGPLEGVENNIESCRGDASTLPPYVKPEPEDLAFLYYTSGTTGLPKAVVLNHRTTEPRVIWLSTQGGLRHGTHNRALGCMPLSHAIGFYGVFLVTLAFNGTFYIVSDFDPVKIVDLFEREKLNYAFCIPTMFQAMVSAPNYTAEKFASMELALTGGVTIDPGLLEHIDREWGGTIRHIYGTTETMCSLYNPDPVGRHASLRPGFYSRTRIVRIGGDGPDDVVVPGEEGELIVDAAIDTIFSEYLGQPDATAEKLREGWYYTGDMFRQEKDGDVTIVGRVDDMIRSGGESIHPEEVESVIESHHAVSEVSVVGITDPKWGQMVTACIKCHGGDPATLAVDIDHYCRASTLAGFKRPKAYFFVDDLPRNAANKVLRRLLRDSVLKAQGAGDTKFRQL